jgi:hypothetical protein
MKLIHHLSAGPYPRKDPESVMAGFLGWAGLEPVEGIGPQLELLRKMQIGEILRMNLPRLMADSRNHFP